MENINSEMYKDLNKKITSCNLNQYIDLVSLLQTSYSKEELANIYLYILETSNNINILNYTIAQIDKLKEFRAIDLLIDILLLKDKFAKYENGTNELNNLRCSCAKVISNFKSQKGVYPLVYCLNNKEEDYKLRLSCAEALGKIGDKYAVLPLIDILKDENEKSVYVKESAAIALGMLGDNRALNPLISILESKNGLVSKFSFLKERIIEVLSKFGSNNTDVFKALSINLSDESPFVRISAIEALANCDNDNKEKTFGLIKNCLLKEDNEEVIEACLFALFNLSNVETLYEIINQNQDNIKIKLVLDDILPDLKDDVCEEFDNENK